jgi:hypothetical protein
VLAIESQPASPDIAERLGLADGTPVLVRKRRYLAMASRWRSRRPTSR